MEVSNEIMIENTRERVWEHTIDVESWPKWNPTMKSIVRQEESLISEGATALIDQEGMKQCLWTVRKVVNLEAFSWETNLYGMRILATHQILPVGNIVKNVLILNVTGIVGFILWPFLKVVLLKSIIQENKYFKKYCEL